MVLTRFPIARLPKAFDRNGNASLTAQDDISNTTQTNFNVTATKNVNLTATGDIITQSNNLTMNASGSAQLQCQKFTMKSQSDMNLTGQTMQATAESMAGIKAPTDHTGWSYSCRWSRRSARTSHVRDVSRDWQFGSSGYITSYIRIFSKYVRNIGVDVDLKQVALQLWPCWMMGIMMVYLT